MQSAENPQKKTSLLRLLKRCGRLIDAEIDTSLKRHSIARSQYGVLYLVAHYGEPSQTDLLEVLKIQAPTLTLIVGSLVRKGWLARTPYLKDKRIHKLRLTINGKKKFRQIPDPVSKLQRVILRNLNAKEVRMLETTLSKVIKKLSPKDV